jgi:hypothetical protein
MSNLSDFLEFDQIHWVNEAHSLPEPSLSEHVMDHEALSVDMKDDSCFVWYGHSWRLRKDRIDKHYDPRDRYRVDGALIKAPSPPATVLVQNRTSTKEENDVSERRNKNPGVNHGDFTSLRNSFLGSFRKKIREELQKVGGLVKLQVPAVGHDCGKRFVDTAKGNEIQLGWHGTREANIDSIFNRGLIIPGHGGVTVRNGSAYGVGIYTATGDNPSLSRAYCDSDKMILVGVVNDEGKLDEQEEDTVEVKQTSGRSNRKKKKKNSGCRAFGTRGNCVRKQHREHRRPMKQQQHGQAKPRSKTVEQYSGFRVIFDGNYVSPLAVVSVGRNACGPSPGSGVSGLYQVTIRPPVAKPVWVGRRRTQVDGTGSITWIPPEPVKNMHAIKVRRRHNAKCRDQKRKGARINKRSLL